VPALILLTENGQNGRQDIRTVSLPLQPVALANILNGKTNDTEYHEVENPGVRFTAPDARVLVVDDIETNLDVAQGLLSPYKMTIDRASGGLEAVRMTQENPYDLVLMDHMMPDMDGIEATEAIRQWEEEQRGLEKSAPGFGEGGAQGNPPGRIPIIALTANAISGMREMFLEKGFSDYLAKPIEIAKLDEMMTRWIPPEKRIKAGAGIKRDTFTGESGLRIPGVDVKQGINMTGGTEAGYRKVLAQFYKDAAERLPILAAWKPGDGDNTVLPAFSAQVHALKSAAGTIGAAEVSAEAAALEAAGKAGDTRTIAAGLPRFCEHLARLIEGITTALEERREAEGPGPQSGGEGKTALLDSLPALRTALETKNMKDIDRLLAELEAAADGETAEGITDISDKVLMGEYEKAIESINILSAAKER
jgi:CheY-like chemotaxis protein